MNDHNNKPSIWDKQPFSENLEHIRVLFADICACKDKGYYR